MQQLIASHPFLFGGGTFVTIWLGVSILISYISGWAALAENYRTTVPYRGDRWSWQSAEMRWMAGYNNCLTAGADRTGLYLSISLFLCRVAHPPLFVP